MHKSEIGAVALNLASAGEVSEAYHRIAKNVSEHRLAGVLVWHLRADIGFALAGRTPHDLGDARSLAARGVTLSDELFRFFHPVATVQEGKINLATALPDGAPIKAGDKLWLLDVGPGDTVEVPWISSPR